MPRHLAQLNVATPLAPLDDPTMTDFVANLDRLNALAERTPGFVWRLQADGGGSPIDIRPMGDDTLINMSVWASAEALRGYVYQSEHVDFLRDRRRWFTQSTIPISVLWWIPAGTVPTVDEGIERLSWLRSRGPSEHAFTFKTIPKVAQPPLSEPG